jgi:hypothetical protein
MKPVSRSVGDEGETGGGPAKEAAVVIAESYSIII